MALRKWSVIEDELKKAYSANDPRLLRYLGEVHERLREQHQQIMQIAEYIDKQSDMIAQMTGAFGNIEGILNKMGVKDALEEIEGDPDETGSTYHAVRDGKKDH